MTIIILPGPARVSDLYGPQKKYVSRPGGRAAPNLSPYIIIITNFRRLYWLYESLVPPFLSTEWRVSLPNKNLQNSLQQGWKSMGCSNTIPLYDHAISYLIISPREYYMFVQSVRGTAPMKEFSCCWRTSTRGAEPKTNMKALKSMSGSGGSVWWPCKTLSIVDNVNIVDWRIS